MIALVLVIGIAVALSVAGWVSLVRGALGSPARQPVPARAAQTVLDDEPVAEVASV